jgi:hypothetical protein
MDRFSRGSTASRTAWVLGGLVFVVVAVVAWVVLAGSGPQKPVRSGGGPSGTGKPRPSNPRPGSPSPSATRGSSGGPRGGFQANGCWVGRLGDGPNSMHGDGTWVYADGSSHHLIADLGDITSVAGGTVTLTRADGTTIQAPTDASTCYTMNGQDTSLSGLSTGARAIVVREDGVATTVRAGQPILSPQDMCSLDDDLVTGDVRVEYEDGSTREFHDDRGTITDVDAQTVSLERPDGQEVSLQLDQVSRLVVDCSPSSTSGLAPGQYVDVVSESGHAHVIVAETT